MAGLPTGFSNLNTAQATMTGSAVQLADFPASEVVLTAHESNVGAIYIGPSGVLESSGLELAPGASVTLHIAHTGMLHAIGTNGDVLTYLAAF